ncbi:MAG: beta-Ala-His dipeptidase [Promethearchaeota archaeon]|jgi:dipeptidase D
MSVLKNLGQPEEFWEYFEQISSIPRCSQHEEKIRAFIKAEAEKFGFTTKMDKVGNLAVSIPSKSGPKEKIILQCHMDMVCEKNDDVKHDFLKDPLKLKVIERNKDKWLTAEGTTLGADNGTGICYNLTLMKKISEDNITFNSLSIQLLFTVLEEFNLGGAKLIDKNLVNGNYLINLDSGGEGMITNGCTGGIGFISDIKTYPISSDQLEKDFIPIQITLGGLVGGHSGGDINRGRGNANKLLCHFLYKIHQNYPIHISSINGGGAANAIPREARAILYVKEDQFLEVHSVVHSIFLEMKKMYEGIEENIQFSTEKIEHDQNRTVFSKEVQDKLINLLYIIPSGTLKIHPKIKAYALVSTNIGIIKTSKRHIRLRWLHRSFNKNYNQNTCEKVIELLKMTGLDMKRKITGNYPPWEPNSNSKLLNLAKDTYKELFNITPPVILIQGGLEATLLINLNPKMKAIAIGPTAIDVHSPNERLRVNSIEKTWNFLLGILKKLD